MKRIIGLVVVLAMALGLCGCADILQEHTIGKDSITTKATMDIEKEYYDDLLKDPSLDTTDRMMLNELKTAMPIVKKDGKDYYRYQQTQTNSFADFMEAGNMNDDEDGVESIAYVTNEVLYIKQSSTDMLSGAESLWGDINKLDLSKITFTITMTFGKDVVNTNGTINTNNKKQAIFNTDPKAVKATIFASTNKNITQTSVEQMIAKSRKMGKAKIKKITANKVKKKAKKASVTLKLKKVKGAQRYTIWYCKNKKFTGSSSDYKETKKTKVTIKGLKKNTKYYFKVYPSRKDFTGTYYDGADSKIKSIKTKKYKKSKKK